MRLTKLNPETGLYEYKEKARTQEEYNEQRKAVIQRLGEIEDRAEWISVEDRLPQPSEKCLVSAKVGDEVVIDMGELIPCYSFRTKERYTEWLITNDWDEGQGCEITHWMPLPKPPKMKGADDEQR